MTTSFNIMALFCEDIRQEHNGVFTLIGILPDNVSVNVESVEEQKQIDKTSGVVPNVLGKLCIYVRVNFDPEENLGAVNLRLVEADGAVTELGPIDSKTVEGAKKSAKERGTVMAGVISRVVFGGFKFEKSGPLKLEAEINGKTYVAGAINIAINKPQKDS